MVNARMQELHDCNFFIVILAMVAWLIWGPREPKLGNICTGIVLGSCGQQINQATIALLVIIAIRVILMKTLTKNTLMRYQADVHWAILGMCFSDRMV